jgi:miniconductance mechanosensitive channel
MAGADDLLRKDIFEFFTRHLYNWLLELGAQETWARAIADFSGFLFVIAIAIIAFYLTKFIIVRTVHRFASRSSSHWDDAFVARKVFSRLSYFVPALIIHSLSPYVIPDYPNTLSVIRVLVKVYIDTMGLVVAFSVLNAALDIYNSYELSKSRPIKGFIQVIKIVMVLIYIVILVTILFVKDNSFGWLAGLGAFSAVLLLVFKDPILGFVGGIQLTTNDMVRIGDWIEMSKYGADGTVVDITITTVKVQNWDKTITTIPTYSLISDSFRNWRGMEESGGRRIKRSIMIDQSSVKFCTEEMLDRFSKFEHVAGYVKNKEEEIEKYNKSKGINDTVLVNGRRQTNLGVFRAYLSGYLKNNPNINPEMTFLIRHLQPTERGIPMEIYVFSKIQEWATYEDIQSDIFDHILASISHFDLRVFQEPTGYDMQKMGKVNE